MSGDRLQTERLILRRLAPRDADGYIAFCRSRRARFAGGPRSAAAAWREFAGELGHWDLRGYGMFAVTERGGDDTCLGLVGPWYPADWPEREVGWLIWAGAEGKGYAAEAARACLAHVFGRLGWETAVSYIDEGNTRSIALAERLGASRDDAAPTPSACADTLVFRHARAAWTGEAADA